MLNFKRKLRIVIFDCPYDHWSVRGRMAPPSVDESTGRLFHEMVKMKLAGFGKEYQYGALPVDTTDFIATHQLVCIENKDGFLPIMGYKSLTLERSKLFNLTFPGLALVKGAESVLHIRAVEEILRECEKNSRSIAYTGSWTVAPAVRSDREFCLELRDLFCAIYVSFHKDNEIHEILSGGTMRFKADSLIASLGHEPLALQGRPLDPIHAPHLHGEKVRVMHLKRFTAHADELAARWAHLWNARVTISPNRSGGDLLEFKKAS